MIGPGEEQVTAGHQATRTGSRFSRQVLGVGFLLFPRPAVVTQIISRSLRQPILLLESARPQYEVLVETCASRVLRVHTSVVPALVVQLSKQVTLPTGQAQR